MKLAHHVRKPFRKESIQKRILFPHDTLQAKLMEWDNNSCCITFSATACKWPPPGHKNTLTPSISISWLKVLLSTYIARTCRSVHHVPNPPSSSYRIPVISILWCVGSPGPLFRRPWDLYRKHNSFADWKIGNIVKKNREPFFKRHVTVQAQVPSFLYRELKSP